MLSFWGVYIFKVVTQVVDLLMMCSEFQSAFGNLEFFRAGIRVIGTSSATITRSDVDF